MYVAYAYVLLALMLNIAANDTDSIFKEIVIDSYWMFLTTQLELKVPME